MNFNEIWTNEKSVIQKCITGITYDEILVDTLKALEIEIEEAIIKEYDCIDKMSIILDVLETPRYIQDNISKATDDEKQLLEGLKTSLYILMSSMKHLKYPSKESVVSQVVNEPREKLPSSEESIKKYKVMFEKVEMEDYNDNKRMTRY